MSLFLYLLSQLQLIAYDQCIQNIEFYKKTLEGKAKKSSSNLDKYIGLNDKNLKLIGIDTVLGFLVNRFFTRKQGMTQKQQQKQ